MAVVAARTPPRPGARGESISAFIVDMDSPGIEMPHRCRFMGLRALYNGVICFRDVRVPAENLLGTEGRGLKVALTALNSGRLSIPAACTGIAKNCLRISREWAASRVQWGSPIGRHDAIAQKLRLMAARVFAMEAMVFATAHKVDVDKRADIRLEAAMTKLWVTEETWRLINDAVQILGGRGYETASSLVARGEPANPLERYLRDARVNTIFEGSSEILRLFIMREALDPHLRTAGAALNSQASTGERAKAFARAAAHYAWWYPSRWLPLAGATPEDTAPRALAVLGEVRFRSRRLARSLFHRMVFHGVALEKRQALLARHADIAAELYALSAATARADSLLRSGKAPAGTAELLADVARLGLERVDQHFASIGRNTDTEGYALAQRVLDGEFAWLEDGVM
jgi:alkylation response protein AidB-like acyl-CoA dehydrogenase